MDKTFLFVLIASGLIISSGAEGADWRLLSMDSDQCEFFVDVSSITPAGNDSKTVWVKSVSGGPMCATVKYMERMKLELSTQGYGNYRQTLTQMEINCPAKSLRFLSSTDYDNKGKALSSLPSAPTDFAAIPSDSYATNLYKAVCK